ncbi:MAG: hypothetical protein ACR2N3_08760 [Pyrinomonadaceae bacterium]
MSLKRFSDNKLFVQLTVFLISFLLVFSRRPDAVLNPQFWAEDGKFWYAEAYNSGIFSSLLTPNAGYFQTISRLVAIAAQFIPFLYAPMLFNLVAITIKILFVNVLISSRCVELIPNKIVRFTIAFIYLALPNSYEVHANLTNAQWHLALLACLIILAKPGGRLAWRIFDIAVITLSVLSGPFCLFLLPVVFVQWRRTKNLWTRNLFYIVLAGALIQICSLIFLSPRPSNAELGATIELFFKIIGGQIFLASLIGQSIYAHVGYGGWWTISFAVAVTIAGCLPVAYAVWKGKPELKLYLLFAGLITLGALLSPAVVQEKPQWQELWLPYRGNRYWLIPMFGFILSLIFTAAQTSNRYLRTFAALFLLTLPIGIYEDWSFEPYKDMRFPEQARKLADAPTGSEVEIPINPNWTMTLVKK